MLASATLCGSISKTSRLEHRHAYSYTTHHTQHARHIMGNA